MNEIMVIAGGNFWAKLPRCWIVPILKIFPLETDFEYATLTLTPGFLFHLPLAS